MVGNSRMRRKPSEMRRAPRASMAAVVRMGARQSLGKEESLVGGGGLRAEGAGCVRGPSRGRGGWGWRVGGEGLCPFIENLLRCAAASDRC